LEECPKELLLLFEGKGAGLVLESSRLKKGVKRQEGNCNGEGEKREKKEEQALEKKANG